MGAWEKGVVALRAARVVAALSGRRGAPWGETEGAFAMERRVLGCLSRALHELVDHVKVVFPLEARLGHAHLEPNKWGG